MRRFFITLFILSLIATAAAITWRTYSPEGRAPMVQADRAPSTRSASPADRNEARRAPGTTPSAETAASDRQDWAVTVSIVSSVVSALAALFQTWLTARAVPVRRIGD
jgi:hypothetical protein